MNEANFFSQIVLPTVEEFTTSPGDIRRGVLACLVLQAMNEHYFHHYQSDEEKTFGCKTLNDFKKKLRAKDWAFGQIMDIANGTKHAKKKFLDLHHERPGNVGVARVGFPISDEPHVFVDDDNAWLLYQLTEYVTNQWCVKLDMAKVFSD